MNYNQIPKNLNYNIVKPVGFPSTIRYEKFTPVSFNTANSGVSSQDVVRFNISSQGFWDPYSAYIKIEVDVSQMDGVKGATANLSVGSLQLDNSAHSLINQLIIYKGGTELERIEEYDTLAAILNDVHGSFDNRGVRNFQGMSGQNLSQNYQYSNPFKQAHTSGAISGSTLLQTGYNPLLTINSNVGSVVVDDLALNNNNTTTTTNNCNRYEYTLNYHDAKSTLQTTTPNSYVIDGILTSNSTVKMGQTFFPGYMQPFCPQLSGYSNESILSKNIPQFTTYKGKLGQHIYNDRQTFCIPIISGLLGVLMPLDSYRYIPMKTLQDLILEFRLSPYALFTSGYADQTLKSNTLNAVQAMNTTTNPMLTRSYRITKFELNVEIQTFSPSVESIVLSKLQSSEGIVLHTTSWQLGPRFNINANTSPAGSYQINLNFESLKTVMFCFMPDDYINYSFCRKQYRISHNITQLYLKIGNEYFPPLPITGHAGTANGYQSITNDYDANNTDFVVQLYKTFGKFNDIQAASVINNINFAVNQRPYDPTNVASLYNASSTNFTNLDTTLSLPLFHENRCVGRSVYAMDLETVNQDQSVMSGINTSRKGASPWEITLKSDQTNAFTRNSTMYVFCQYDLLIQLMPDQCRIYGKN